MNVEILQAPRPVHARELKTRDVFYLRDHWYLLVSKTHERDDTHVAFGLETGAMVFIDPSDEVLPARSARVVIEP